MNVQGKPTRTIWTDPNQPGFWIIDQTRLPHQLQIVKITTVDGAAHAIQSMQVRGAPLIGATAAHGIAVAISEDPSNDSLHRACAMLLSTRPTAINLRWALDRVHNALEPIAPSLRANAARNLAESICEEDVKINQNIARHGTLLLRDAWRHKVNSECLHVLTHCNAGWLATVDWGTALAPIYMAHDAGIPIHVWVDETRPRNQGASLTAWELSQHGVPNTIIVDNAGGHLMQQGLVDLCIVGTDRTTANGDVANKIGTYLKALAAHDNKIPFYVALPSPSLDTTLSDGVREIPIEQRNASEITHVTGRLASGAIATVEITPEGCHAENYGFDVTPARLITALITERGVCLASEESLRSLFPERFPQEKR